ncbi:unnamed protein product [Calicophoron daubneyi]|uniref:DnaJ homolog subfamily B member 9 n=1 Tax=Calicophoron daubneyi TaxID=300641 RepID=A0AAV2TJ60_CALDB
MHLTLRPILRLGFTYPAGVLRLSSRLLSSNNGIKDYYAVLQVKPTASQAEIKNAFLELSKKYHPDAAKGDASKIKFIEISEAFSVLGKIETRQEYDANRKLAALGLLGDGFRMEYPRPSSEFDPVVLRAYDMEMRRRWNERLQEWAQSQGAYELERGIHMSTIQDTVPHSSRSTVSDNETRLYFILAGFSCCVLFACVYYVVKPPNDHHQ